MTAGERPAVASLAEEAARLADTLAAWAGGMQAGGDAPSGWRAHAASAGAAAARAVGVAATRVSEPVRAAAPGTARAPAAPPETAEPRTGEPRAGEPGEAPECALCPVCSAIRLAKGVRPEAVEHLLDAASSLMLALRSVGAGEPDPGAAGPAAASHVERIDIR